MKKVTGVALGLAAVIVTTVALRSGRGPSGTAAATSASASSNVALAYPPKGTGYVYAFRFRQTTAVDGLSGTPAMNAATDVEGRLALADVTRPGASTTLAASIAEITTASLRFMGRETLPQEPGLVGATVLVDLDAQGAVTAFRFPRSGSVTSKLLLRSLALELVPRLGGSGPLWSANEETPSGSSTTFYATTGDPLRFERVRRGYLRLGALGDRPIDEARLSVVSHGAVALAADGALVRVDDEEKLRVVPAGPAAAETATTELEAHFELVSRSGAPPGLDGSAFERWSADKVPAVVESDADRLARMAGDLKMEDIEAGVGRAEQGPPRTGFVAEATAYLRLHPEACEALVKGVDGEGHGDRPARSGVDPARSMVADLLASAGTTEAQKALRSLATSSAVRESPRLERQILQRFVFVGAPDAASIAFLEARRQAARSAHDEDAELACATTLGATARKLGIQGRRDEAERITSSLQRDLEAAKSPERQRALLSALGNAAAVAQVKTITSYAKAKDPKTRAVAAHALRAMDSADARDALRSLAADEDTEVARAALGSLAQQPTSDADVRAIADLAVQGASAGLGNDLVTFFSAHLDAPGDVGRALDAIEARTSGDAALSARIESLREQLAMRAAVAGRR